ncbi:MAG: T9SS type A sorting domain-containing protein [Flavobacteriales bacterium]
MKNIHTSLLLLAAASASAQQVHTAFPEHREAKHSGRVAATSGTVHAHAKSVDYYTEEFTSSLNGWTVLNTVGDLDWTWTDVGPGPTTSTYPVPPIATTTGGWALIDDDLLGQSGVETDTWLISPVIDLSLAPQYLKLEFDQYFQEFQTDTTYVGITVDGGLSWNQITINDGVGRDGRPNPELIDLNISDLVALGPSTVQLGFRYQATWDYGWQVDNIHITDLEENDIALLNTHFTNFDFDNTGFSEIEYSVYPQQQVRPMQLKADIKNKGYATQTDVTFGVEVLGPGGPEYNSTTAVGDMQPAASAPAANDGFTPSAAIGTYEVDFHATQNEVDDGPDDNDRSMSFQVSADVFAQDDGVVQQYQTQGLDNVDDQFEVGNYYEMVQDQDLLSIRVALHANTVPGTLIYGIVYDDQNPPGQIDVTEDYEVTPADLNALGGSTFVDLPLSTPLFLTTGQIVLVMAGCYGGPEQVAFATSGSSAAQVSIINYPGATDPIFFVTKTPMVRAVFANTTSVSEIGGAIDAVVLSPNPTDGNAALDLDLVQSAEVRLEIRDMSGRMVLSDDLGKLPAGKQNVYMDLRGLSAGTYSWTLNTNEQHRTGLLVRN